MAKRKTVAAQVIDDALTANPKIASRTLARQLYAKQPELWPNQTACLTAIRGLRGAIGKGGRRKIATHTAKRSKAESAACQRWGALLPEPEPSEFQWHELPEGKGEPTRWLIMSDVHVPYHDNVIKTVFAHAENNCDGVLLLGDIADAYQLSYWERDPRKRRFIEEVEAVKQFLDAVLALKPKRVYWKAGNHECFDGDTEVLTDTGWVLFRNLAPTAKVGSYNTTTKCIEFAIPSAIHRSQYAGDLYRVVSEQVDVCATPNHRMVVRCSNGDSWHKTRHGRVSPWMMDTLSSLATKPGVRRAMPVAAMSGLDDYPLTDDEIRIAAWILTDGSITTLKQTSGIVSNYYLFYQRQSKVHKVTEILDRLGWKYSIYTRNRNTKAVCGRPLIRSPEPEVCVRLSADRRGSSKGGSKPCVGCGVGRYPRVASVVDGAHRHAHALVSERGHLPEWVFKLSDRQFRIFLESFVDGDGSRHKSAPDTSWMAYGTKALLDDLQRACITHGFRASLASYRKLQWRLNITPGTETHIDKCGEHIQREPYDGDVWCVTTHNDTVVVRRNGKVAITGNSRLERYLMQKAPELFDMPAFSWPAFCELEERGITWVPPHDPISHHALTLIHGHEWGKRFSSPINPARGAFLKAYECTIEGHGHRTSNHTEHTLRGRSISCWSLGCLCNLHPKYRALGNKWKHGFAYLNAGHEWSIDNHQVIHGKVQ